MFLDWKTAPLVSGGEKKICTVVKNLQESSGHMIGPRNRKCCSLV